MKRCARPGEGDILLSGLKMQLEMVRKNLGEFPLLQLSGSLVLETVTALKKSVAPWIEASPGLALDLSGLTVIDSSGMGTLLQWHGQLLRVGKKLVLFGLSQIVRETFHMDQLLSLLHLYPDQNQALWALHESKRPFRSAPALDSSDF